MGEISYRKAREADLWDCARIHQLARDDMFMRNGRPAGQGDLEHDVYNFRHVLSTGIFEVAEVDGQVVAVCHGVVRDRIWFLSSFWVIPDMQNRHIGGPLLKRVWQQGREAGAETFCVWSSIDYAAMAAYFKLGMLPGTQLLNFGATADRATLPPVPGGYTTALLSVDEAAAIDTVVRATPRPQDHRFWLQSPDRRGSLVLKNGRPVGYYYVTDKGDVTPAAWLDPADGEAVLAVACHDGLARAGATLLRLPGYNHTGIAFAMRSGFVLKGFSHFLTSAPFGRLDQYAASGPLLF